MKKSTIVYICSSTYDGGVLRYRLSDDGTLAFLDKTPLPTPNWMFRDGDKMYVTLNNLVENELGSGVAALLVGEAGALSPIGEFQPTGGASACHIAADGEDVYVANYRTGSVTHMGHGVITHEGRGVHPTRQEAPHCHCTFFSPDKKYVIVCDLGTDTIYTYDRGMQVVSTAKVPDGEGCRHLVFSKDGKYVYVMNELGCSISVFAYDDGKLTYLSTTPTKCGKPHDGPDKGSAIKLSRNGKYLFTTNRGENQVLTIRIQGKGERLKVVSRAETMGEEPRDFSLLLDERFAIVTNQFSDSIILYRVSRMPFGRLKHIAELSIPAPLFVREAEG